MSILRFDINLYASCAQTGCVRWQSGGPPPALATDVSLAGCTATASIWTPQSWSSPIVAISTTPTANGSITISTFAGAQVPSLVTWTWNAAAVALVAPTVPLDEARLMWGLNILFPSGSTWPFIRGRVTVKP